MSTGVWVPIVTAALGLVTGLGTGIGTAFYTQRQADHREDVRWNREKSVRKEQWAREDQNRQEQWGRERKDRGEQWGRERQDRLEQWMREDSQRWLQERQQAYARFITALYEWQAVLDKVRVARWRNLQKDTYTEFNMAAVGNAREVANSALISLRFIAPKSLGDKAHYVFWIYGKFPGSIANIKSGRDLEDKWKEMTNRTEALLSLMGNDLGLEISPDASPPPETSSGPL